MRWKFLLIVFLSIELYWLVSHISQVFWPDRKYYYQLHSAPSVSSYHKADVAIFTMNKDSLNLTINPIELSNRVVYKDNLNGLIRLVVEDEAYVKFLVQEGLWGFGHWNPENWALSAGSSAWLEKYGFYLSTSRLMYLPERKEIGKPYVSALVVQLFDKDWNELAGNYEIGIPNTKFPFIIPIPPEDIHRRGHWIGPEDPRLILAPCKKTTEPLVFFNMETRKDRGYRRIFVYNLRSHEMKRLSINFWEYTWPDKNWAPFFDRDLFQCKANKKRVSFVYSVSPLLVINCDYTTGSCETIGYPQDQYGEIDPIVGPMKGGTNLVPLPNLSRGASQAWVGISRARIQRRDENGDFYRPTLFLLAKTRGGKFIFKFMTSPLEVEYDLPKDYRSYSDVVKPYSIPYWRIDENGDHLGLTLTRDDALRYAIEIKGVYNLVQKFLGIGTNTEWYHSEGQGAYEEVEVKKYEDEVDAETIEYINSQTVNWATEMTYRYMLAKRTGADIPKVYLFSSLSQTYRF